MAVGVMNVTRVGEGVFEYHNVVCSEIKITSRYVKEKGESQREHRSHEISDR